MENAIVKIKDDLYSDESLTEFARAVGPQNAGSYITSVMIAVSNDERLMACSPQSIRQSALRAASLRLSVDPATGEGYLVAYKGKCTFIPGYKGYIELAYRTNQYRYINVAKIYKGQEVTEDQRTGFHTITGPLDKSQPVIGYLAAFALFNGLEKDIYMTVEEIHAYAKKTNPGGYSNKFGAWTTNTGEMERKTPLRTLLRKWGKMSEGDKKVLEEVEKEAEFDDEMVDAEAIDHQELIPATTQTDAEILAETKEIIETKDAKKKEMIENPDGKDDGMTHPDDLKKDRMDVKIVEAVAKIIGCSNGDAAMTISEGFKKKAIPEKMTVNEARKWAKTLI